MRSLSCSKGVSNDTGAKRSTRLCRVGASGVSEDAQKAHSLFVVSIPANRRVHVRNGSGGMRMESHLAAAGDAGRISCPINRPINESTGPNPSEASGGNVE
jgi:hypothetical protein